MASPLAWGGLAAVVAFAALLVARELRRALRRRRERAELAASRQPGLVASLEELLMVKQPLPELGGWAIAPDLAILLVREVLGSRPQRVLELGSGASTVILAEALERVGGGRLVSLEHDEAHAAATSRALARRGLTGRARVVVARLVPDAESPEGSGGFYDLSTLARLLPEEGPPWDLVLVDGPPATGHPQARRPALPRLVDRLAPRAVMVLDDGRRPGERAVVDGWRAHGLLEDMTVEQPPLLRGAFILRRAGSAPD